MLAHGQQVSAMVDEMDLGAGLGEPTPEIASDAAGAVDGDPHAIPSPATAGRSGTTDLMMHGLSAERARETGDGCAAAGRS